MVASTLLFYTTYLSISVNHTRRYKSLRMRRFLSLSEPWVLPFGRSSKGARVISSGHYGSPHYHRITQRAPQQQFQRFRFSCQEGSRRASSVIDELSISSPSVFLGAESTIYALSTAPGRAAIAIIRISGPACLQVLPRYFFEQSEGRPLMILLNRYIEHYVPEYETPNSAWRRYEHYTIRRKPHRRTHSSTLAHWYYTFPALEQ